MARGAKNQKTSKSENTKRHIVTSFLALMADKPWEKISVIEICRTAEITRGTFYQYFGDIYDLMEQLENSLLTDLKSRFDALPARADARCRVEDFLTKYNYAPPEAFLAWFGFCRDHRDAMMALLDRKNGDTYFVKKLKALLLRTIGQLMDADGLPNDDLRSHFLTVFTELHLLAAKTWLDSESAGGEGEFLSVDDIVNILNTMRVGGQYLTWCRCMDPDYERKMSPRK